MGSRKPNLLIITNLLLELKAEGRWEKGQSLRITYTCAPRHMHAHIDMHKHTQSCCLLCSSKYLMCMVSLKSPYHPVPWLLPLSDSFGRGNKGMRVFFNQQGVTPSG